MFTWRRKNPIKQARSDFFLISEFLLSMVLSIKSGHSYRSDHIWPLYAVVLLSHIIIKAFHLYNAVVNIMLPIEYSAIIWPRI